MIEYTLSSNIKDFLALSKLWTDHYNEVEVYKEHSSPSSLDVKEYEKAINSGQLRIVTAKEGGEVVGYCATLLQKSMHYRGVLYANNDAIYVAKSYRGKMVGARLLSLAVGDSTSLGAKVYFINMKIVDNLGFEPILKRLGFSYKSQTWAKEL